MSREPEQFLTVAVAAWILPRRSDRCSPSTAAAESFSYAEAFVAEAKRRYPELVADLLREMAK